MEINELDLGDCKMNERKYVKEEFLIPIDDAIEAFCHHLDAHDRTILSARFGDGKSFFLSHFIENVDVAEHYTFLTIFPVNYQVTENRDVVDFIKRSSLSTLSPVPTTQFC